MNEPGRTVILDDVARLSGVSRATASRALGGKPGVAPDVRERVETIAKALDYRPNRAAKNLAGGSTSLIALLLGPTDLYHNPYSARLLDSIAKAAEDLDQGLMIVMSEREPVRAVTNLIRDRIVDGVIVSSVVFGTPWAERLIDSDMPTVLMGAHPTRVDHPVVKVENRQSAHRLVCHLFASGCRRIGLIAGPIGRIDADERRAGYLTAHQLQGIEVDPDLMISGAFDRASGYEGATALLDRGVDAIFAANDQSAYGALQACDEHGAQVPADVSVAGFDGASEMPWSRHDLTTVVQPFDKLARKAVEMLLGLDGGIVEIAGEIHAGGTTRRAD